MNKTPTRGGETEAHKIPKIHSFPKRQFDSKIIANLNRTTHVVEGQGFVVFLPLIPEVPRKRRRETIVTPQSSDVPREGAPPSADKNPVQDGHTILYRIAIPYYIESPYHIISNRITSHYTLSGKRASTRTSNDYSRFIEHH